MQEDEHVFVNINLCSGLLIFKIYIVFSIFSLINNKNLCISLVFVERMKMKRDNHDDGPHSDKRSRRNDDQVRILIPSNVSREGCNYILFFFTINFIYLVAQVV